MDIVSLKEVVDLRAVKYLNSMPKAWWKEILNTDKDRKFEVEYKKVKSFLSGQLDGTGIIRQYKFADGKTFGRQFDHSGLQGSGLSFERKKDLSLERKKTELCAEQRQRRRRQRQREQL